VSKRRLSPDEIKALQDGQQVWVRLTRLFWPKPVAQYEGPDTLYVQRYRGEIVTMTTREHGWAEYDPRHSFEHDGSLVSEDWQMEVFEP